MTIEASTATDLYAMAQGDMLLTDRKDMSGFHNMKVRTFIHQARRFSFDHDASQWLLQMAYEQHELIRELKEFAICPYEKIVIETGICGLGDPLNTKGVFVLLCSGRKVNIVFFDPEQERFLQDYEIEERWAIKEYALLIPMAFYLALASKKAHVVSSTPTRHSVRRGKRVAYFGHSVIKIDLTTPKQLKRCFSSGTHATPRRHEVMGHFVHRGGDRNCTHAWEKLDRDDGLLRWVCSECERKRTWRKAFGRGDANKGFVHQSYTISAALDHSSEFRRTE